MAKFDLQNKTIFVAGHNGMVGSAICRALQKLPVNILTANKDELDLLNEGAVKSWMALHKPNAVILAAARVGGIFANDTYPVDFLLQNLKIQNNVIEAAHQQNISKLLFLGSSCIYPKHAEQPIKEDYLLTAPLEPSNEWYAIAKIAGLKLCQAYRKQYGSDFISAMPTNLYGPNDNFHPEHSHVPAALLRRFHEAKEASKGEVLVWGTGKPRREFLHVDDLASACIHLLQNYSDIEPVNIGTGEDISIADFAERIAEVVGYIGKIGYDESKPDGTMLKRLDVSKINSLGWSASISLADGLKSTYEWAVSNNVL